MILREELADSIRASIRVKENSAVLLDHHGFLAIGRDIYQAAIRAEHAEAAARVIYYARQLGGEKPLTPDSVKKLHQSHSKLVEMEAGVYSGYCHADGCQPGSSEAGDGISGEKELEQIVRHAVQQTLAENQ